MQTASVLSIDLTVSPGAPGGRARTRQSTEDDWPVLRQSRNPLRSFALKSRALKVSADPRTCGAQALI